METTILPDGSAFSILTIKQKPFFKRWAHKLFHCPTFWKIKWAWCCTQCGKGHKCYWDGNDINGHGTDICNKCAKKLESKK